MNCPQCGTPLLEGARFCVSCGFDTRLPAVAAPMPPVLLQQPIHYAVAAPAFVAPYAGFWTRLFATLLDVIFFAPLFFMFAMLSVVFLPLPDDPSQMFLSRNYWIFQGLNVLFFWLLYAGFESSAMQGTPGKRVLNVAVTDMDGKRLTFRRASGRFFARYISAMFFLIGYFMVAFTERKQALHDLVAKTLVIRRRA
jgi:uncharacterized RDD family membrane protein YckC